MRYDDDNLLVRMVGRDRKPGEEEEEEQQQQQQQQQQQPMQQVRGLAAWVCCHGGP